MSEIHVCVGYTYLGMRMHGTGLCLHKTSSRDIMVTGNRRHGIGM